MDVGGSDGAATEDRKLSAGAVAAAVGPAAACGAMVLSVLLVMFHWPGRTVPGVGWPAAKGAVKLGTGGVVGPVAALARLRTRRGARNAGAGGSTGGPVVWPDAGAVEEPDEGADRASVGGRS
ncbi:hypothetical protein ACFVYP_25370 [Kitasatospora sp. NPDC058201]|uniref:hypothetical protein n=1 Tax=unclassified Kitasatospora TaxID=2633591 RepID=UPI0036509992